MSEARITVEGTELTPAQSMTVRVAVTAFLAECEDPASQLGAVGQSYADRAREVLKLILAGTA